MPLIPPSATLLLIDLQERLVPAIENAEIMLKNARTLALAAGHLGMQVVVSEQYPKGLGPTLSGLIALGQKALPKLTFDAMATPDISNRLASAGAVVVGGCEAHVCVLQTVVSLRATGRAVWVVADATGSRTAASHQAAMSRMQSHGAEIVTTEMVLFEAMRSAAHPAFRTLSAMIKT